MLIIEISKEKNRVYIASLMENIVNGQYLISQYIHTKYINSMANALEIQAHSNYIFAISYLKNTTQDSVLKYFFKQLFGRKINIQLSNLIIKQYSQQNQHRFSKYLLYYRLNLINFNQKLQDKYIFCNRIKNFYNRMKIIKDCDKNKTIIHLYEQSFSNTENIELLYKQFQALQWLIYAEQKVDNFQQYQQYLPLFDECLVNSTVDSIQKLRCKLCFGLFNDYIELVFNFQQDFNVLSLTDQDILVLFDLTNNSILEIGAANAQECFCFIKNVTTNEIFRFQSDNSIDKQEASTNYGLDSLKQYLNFNIQQNKVKDKMDEFLEQFVKKSLNGDTFDVIIVGQYYKVIEKIQIRNLNYTRVLSFDQNDLRMQYPEALSNIILQNIFISNVEDCINLQNISTKKTKYSEQDISRLTKLIRFRSIDDTFINGKNSVLHLLLINNRLEYVHIEQGVNVTHSLILQQNIECLRYFNINQINAPLDIVFKPDPKKTYKLQAFQVSYISNKDKIIIYYVPGRSTLITHKILKQLIHDPELFL